MKEIDIENMLIKRIKTGDQTALDEIYLKNKPDFTARALAKYNKLPQDFIEDVYQDVMIIFFQNVMNDKLIALRASIGAYLFGIGDNYIKSLLRKNEKENKVKSEILKGDLYIPHEENNKEKLFILMDRLIELMAEKCQKILKFFYFEKKNITFITEHLGFKDKFQTSREKHRCVSRLKKMLFDQLNKTDG